MGVSVDDGNHHLQPAGLEKFVTQLLGHWCRVWWGKQGRQPWRAACPDQNGPGGAHSLQLLC